MNTYITGPTIKSLREAKGITQSDLAEKIGVSSQAISKWETAKGLPDITLIEPLSKALGVSVMELMAGGAVINRNISSNILRSKFYVCPLCGNIIRTTGDTLISCCGITLPALEAEMAENASDYQKLLELEEKKAAADAALEELYLQWEELS